MKALRQTSLQNKGKHIFKRERRKKKRKTIRQLTFMHKYVFFTCVVILNLQNELGKFNGEINSKNIVFKLASRISNETTTVTVIKVIADEKRKK